MATPQSYGRRSAVDPVDELVFGVTLKSLQLVPIVPRERGGPLLDRLEGVGTVDPRLTTAEQVQIGAV